MGRIIPSKIEVPADAPWMPAALRDSFTGRTVNVQFSRGERKIYRKRKPVLVSDWAPKNRVLTDGPMAGRYWDNSIAPWTKDMMNASMLSHVRRIVNCKCVQSAGTTWIYTCLAYAMDRKPGSALIVYPDRDRARKAMVDRINAMIDKSPVLTNLLTGSDEDQASLRVKLINMLIYMGWSGSITSLGDFPAMYLIKDEADKWKEFPSKDEAGSHESADKRVTVFPEDSKIWDNSTPTRESGHIWQALLNETQVISNYWTVCPDCGHAQVMIFKNLKWDGGSSANIVDLVASKLARYVCCHCGSMWDDYHRDLAVQAGGWRCLPTSEWLERFTALRAGDYQAMDDAHDMMPYLQKHKIENIGFHTPAWISSFVSLSKSVGAFLKGNGKGFKKKTALRDFANNFAAEYFADQESERQEDVILALRDERPDGLVPGRDTDGEMQVAAVIAGVDTQDDGYFYVIRAFGYGYDQESWLITDGFVRTTEGLKKILFQHEYKDAEGNVYPVLKVVIDAMGHRTKEVYDFARRHPNKVQASKGASGRKTQPFTLSKIDTYPNSKKLIPGGVILAHVDVNFYKDQLSAMLQVSPTDPGAFHLTSAATTDYARQMTAEFVNEKTGLWDCPNGRANHKWDCEVLLLACADLLRIKFWPRPDQQKTTVTRRVRSRGIRR